jgi:UDP-N-acetylmuramyl pentapeptide phosphotransferase/UDP-N-acetylglucosamine-1-phosphate transferase
MSTTATLVSLVSFALQQLLQLLDPLFSRIFPEDKAVAPVATNNNKKAVMGLLSVVLGFVLVSLVDDLRVLTTSHSLLDKVVSAFVVGAGTEASNTVQKLLSYTKDKIKP